MERTTRPAGGCFLHLLRAMFGSVPVTLAASVGNIDQDSPKIKPEGVARIMKELKN